MKKNDYQVLVLTYPLKAINALLFTLLTVCLILSAAFLCSCAGKQLKDAELDAPMEEPDWNQRPSFQYQASEGSLWPGERRENNFFSDNKARNVGDIITVMLNESTTASKSATTDLSKDNSYKTGAAALLGWDASLEKHNPNLNSSAMIDVSSQNQFKGDGSTERSDTLSGNMTATVMAVLPNGNLRIKGRREVRLNLEKQIMILEGIVRPEDITSENTVDSSYIAEAKITYSGQGVVALKQWPGFGTILLDILWPF